jgi:flagellar protein FlbT
VALKISLKPHEKVIIGGAVVKNGPGRSDFIIENVVPVLREKDIITPEKADSPCRKIYLIIQLMYVDDRNLPQYHKTYWELAGEVLGAAPSQREIIAEISGKILGGCYYQALKLAKKLITYEQEVMNLVQHPGTGLQKRAKDDDDGT